MRHKRPVVDRIREKVGASAGPDDIARALQQMLEEDATWLWKVGDRVVLREFKPTRGVEMSSAMRRDVGKTVSIAFIHDGFVEVGAGASAPWSWPASALEPEGGRAIWPKGKNSGGAAS